MKTSTKILSAAAVLILGAGAVASAGYAHSRWSGHGGHPMGMHRGGHGAHMMERFDADGDGKVTAAEITAAREKAMSDYDADKSGDLTLEEFRTLWLDFMQRRMVRHFQHLDSDGDARVTAEEMKATLQRMMSRMDRNDDGMISRDDRRGSWHHDDHRRHRGGKADN